MFFFKAGNFFYSIGKLDLHLNKQSHGSIFSMISNVYFFKLFLKRPRPEPDPHSKVQSHDPIRDLPYLSCGRRLLSGLAHDLGLPLLCD
jgi:hypothetical protein